MRKLGFKYVFKKRKKQKTIKPDHKEFYAWSLCFSMQANQHFANTTHVTCRQFLSFLNWHIVLTLTDVRSRC